MLKRKKGYFMTIAAICFAYIVIVLSITRLVHVLRMQEGKMRECQTGGVPEDAPNMAGHSKAAA
jgi:hypothetical protein